MKEMPEDKYIREYLKTLEEGGYNRHTYYKARASLRFIYTYVKGITGKEGAIDWSKTGTEDLESFKKHLAGLGKRSEMIKEHIFKVKHFLSFVEKKSGRSVPGLHNVKSNPEGIENYPEEFRNAYFEYSQAVIKADKPKRSINRIKFTIRTFFRYLTEERHLMKFPDIRGADVKEFIRFLMDLNDKEGKKLYSTSTVNIFLTIIRGFLRFMAKKGVCMGLADTIRCVKREDYLSKNILNRKELVKLFSVKAENPAEFMMKSVFVILYGSGLRIGEVLALKFKDIDLEKKEACVFETKTNKERMVQLGEAACEYLRLYIDCVREHFNDEVGTKIHKDDDYIFVSLVKSFHHAEKICSETVNQYLKIFCRRAGIKKLIPCHCFRHSFGTHLLENGAGIKEVSELLGHEDLGTTERYTRLNPEHLRQTLLKYHPREREGGIPE